MYQFIVTQPGNTIPDVEAWAYRAIVLAFVGASIHRLGTALIERILSSKDKSLFALLKKYALFQAFLLCGTITTVTFLAGSAFSSLPFEVWHYSVAMTATVYSAFESILTYRRLPQQLLKPASRRNVRWLTALTLVGAVARVAVCAVAIAVFTKETDVIKLNDMRTVAIAINVAVLICFVACEVYICWLTQQMDYSAADDRIQKVTKLLQYGTLSASVAASIDIIVQFTGLFIFQGAVIIAGALGVIAYGELLLQSADSTGKTRSRGRTSENQKFNGINKRSSLTPQVLAMKTRDVGLDDGEAVPA